MDHPDYQGQVQSGDFGPDSGHYHVFIEVDAYMIPFSDWWQDLDDRHGAYWENRWVAVFVCGQICPVARQGRTHDGHGHVEPETLPEIFHAPTSPWSGRRDLNPRPSRWLRDALPLSYPRALLPALYVGRQMPGDNIWRRLRQRNVSFRCEKPVDPF